MFSKADLEYIQELKNEEYEGYTETGPDGEKCRIKIIGRGEGAFYQRGDRATMFEAFAAYGVILADSIRWWDDGRKITDEERQHIVEMTSRRLKQGGAEKIEVVPVRKKPTRKKKK